MLLQKTEFSDGLPSGRLHTGHLTWCGKSSELGSYMNKSLHSNKKIFERCETKEEI